MLNLQAALAAFIIGFMLVTIGESYHMMMLNILHPPWVYP